MDNHREKKNEPQYQSNITSNMEYIYDKRRQDPYHAFAWKPYVCKQIWFALCNVFRVISKFYICVFASEKWAILNLLVKSWTPWFTNEYSHDCSHGHWINSTLRGKTCWRKQFSFTAKFWHFAGKNFRRSTTYFFLRENLASSFYTFFPIAAKFSKETISNFLISQ